MLLGLLGVDESVAARALRLLGVTHRKARRQIVKDYIAFPLLSGSRKGFKRTFWANFTANIVRNLDEFHTVYATVPGDGLWLDPADRVRIW